MNAAYVVGIDGTARVGETIVREWPSLVHKHAKKHSLVPGVHFISNGVFDLNATGVHALRQRHLYLSIETAVLPSLSCLTAVSDNEGALDSTIARPTAASTASMPGQMEVKLDAPGEVRQNHNSGQAT